MKLRTLTLVVLALFFIATRAELNPQPFVIPELTSWQGAEGNMIPSGRIIVTDKRLLPVAQALVKDYYEMFGVNLIVSKNKASAGDIIFAPLADTQDSSLGNEGYKLAIDQCATITAATPQGAYWATRTILQISEQSAKHALPCGVTNDVPAYPLRGFMLDCGRKYIPLDYLDKLVKVMAYYKMNTLQVHLNDNAFVKYFDNDWSKTPGAFRLESDYFPGLAASDGHYSKQDFVNFQKRAEQQYVDIIPEIDVPAHSLAFTHYRPSLGSTEYGMDHLDLRNPEVVPFLDSLFAEYCAGPDPVFRGHRVHIGTDEYSNKDPQVVELFRSLTDHLIHHVESFGKQAMCWGALTHADGQTPVKSKDVILNLWYNGYADPVKMKSDGFQMISIPDGYVYIVPGAGYYYDYLACDWLYNNWTPAQIGETKFDPRDPQILGGMFALWNDHYGNGITVKDIHHRIMPAMQTLSTLCWAADGVKTPWSDFDYMRRNLSEAPGVNELSRFFHGNVTATTTYPRPTIGPDTTLDWLNDEIGYDYTIEFDLKIDQSAPGDVLFCGPNSVVYLSSPEGGRLAFEREGYVNEFDYQVPVGRTVHLAIQGTNQATTLIVNGRHHQTLYPITVSNALGDYGKAGAVSHHEGKKLMHYQRTLVFPLMATGHFSGTISHLKVSNFAE